MKRREIKIARLSSDPHIRYQKKLGPRNATNPSTIISISILGAIKEISKADIFPRTPDSPARTITGISPSAPITRGILQEINEEIITRLNR